jgi:hypothetical protein
LLALHRNRLAREDLEDCYSQATLELLSRSRKRGAFASHAHIANALEQRLLSRIHDRRRALNGRSPIEAAIATALPLAGGEDGEVEIPDVRADVERLALLRDDLRQVSLVSRRLSPDQRLVLAQRGRARLIGLLAGGLLAGCAERTAMHVELPVPLCMRLSD